MTNMHPTAHTLKIATFNINSVRARIQNLQEWLTETNPDIVFLQELKCQDDQFPTMELQSLGYNSAVFGQKAYNGVAILSKHPIESVQYGLPDIPTGYTLDTAQQGDSQQEPQQDNTQQGKADIKADILTQPDSQSRYIEATICGIRCCCLYLPNGNPVGDIQNSDKYKYKLNWMERLYCHLKNTVLPTHMPVVVGGDFNVIPSDTDCENPVDWVGDAATLPQTKEQYRKFLNLGLTESFTSLNPQEKHAYTFWDYQRGAWQKNNGIRIDFFLTNAYMTDRAVQCWVDKTPRAKEKASDHTPLVLEVSSVQSNPTTPHTSESVTPHTSESVTPHTSESATGQTV